MPIPIKNIITNYKPAHTVLPRTTSVEQDQPPPAKEPAKKAARPKKKEAK